MNSKKPLVSVIIPVYNGEKYLGATIESVIQQTYQSLEILVIDDGSTDNSAAIARSYPKVNYIYQNNQGVAVARNTGIANSQGEFIAFIDQDDLWTSNKLAVQIDYLLKHPSLAYTITKMRTFLEPNIDKPAWLKAEFLNSDISAYIVGSLVARRFVFNQIGDFNPIYKFGNDSDWFFRAIDGGFPVVVIPEMLLYKRIHDANESHKIQAMTDDMLKLVRASIQRKRQQKLTKEA
jgi:glycosyltransferase involved in cell wall biosynthesis